LLISWSRQPQSLCAAYLIMVGVTVDELRASHELSARSQKKAIRLFDLMYIFKHKDGSIESQEVSDLQAEEQREFGTLIRSLIGLSAKDLEHTDADEVAGTIQGAHTEFGLSEEELQTVAGNLPNGSAAIFVVFEHVWARGFKEAIINNNGYIRAQGMLDADTLKVAANELATVLEAIDKTEVASMEKMAVILAATAAREDEARSKAAVVEAEAESIEEAAEAKIAQAESLAQLAEEVEVESLAREEAALKHAAEVAHEAEEMEDQAFLEAEAVRKVAQRQKQEALVDAAEMVQESE